LELDLMFYPSNSVPSASTNLLTKLNALAVFAP